VPLLHGQELTRPRQGIALGWLFTSGPPLSDFELGLSSMGLDMPSLSAIGDLVGISDLAKVVNLTDVFDPPRQWLANRDFQVLFRFLYMRLLYADFITR
jgi:hypothetical protein